MKNKILGLTALVCVLIISIFLFFSNYWKSSMGSSNGSALYKELKKEPFYKDMVIDKIHLDSDNGVYSLKNGEVFKDGVKIQSDGDKETTEKVLRLALFFQWMKEDPLFFSSTIDPENVEDSVKRLKNSQDEYLNKYNWQENIFAVNFLQKFVDASKSYQDLSGEISEKNAGILIQKIEEANAAYLSDAESLKKEIEKLRVTDSAASKKFMLLGGESSTDSNIILSDLGKMEENSTLAEKEIEQRKKCLNDSWKLCQRPSENFTKPEELSAQNESVPKFLPKGVLDLADDTNYAGPYKVNSSCWQGRDTQYLYFSKVCRTGSTYCLENSQLATDTYFVTLSEKFSFDRSLISKGLPIMPQLATNPYTCTDLEFQPKLALVNYFYGEFKDKRFFQNIKNQKVFGGFTAGFKDLIGEGGAAEDRFFDAQYPNEDSLNYMADFYGFIYAYSIKNNLLDEQNREDLLRRRLAIREKMPDYDLLLNKIGDPFLGLFQKLASGDAKPDSFESYVYMTRSDYSLLFLNFSSSVWRSSQKLQYLVKKGGDPSIKYPLSAGIMNYEETISKYGVENLLKWKKIYDQNRMKRYGTGS